MNWTNYDRLVGYLNTIHPKTFDYTTAPDYNHAHCGCLEFHCDTLAQGTVGIEDFLGVTEKEADYLFGLKSDIDPTALPYEDLDQQFQAAGVAGVTEALRRLSVVAARYNRPAEAKFIASVRALAREAAESR